MTVGVGAKWAWQAPPLQRQHSGRGCGAIVEEDDAVGEGFGGEKRN